MDMILNVDNADDFSDNFFILLAIFMSCYKLFSLLTNRKSIHVLIDILKGKTCKPYTDNEMRIQYDFDKSIE